MATGGFWRGRLWNTTFTGPHESCAQVQIHCSPLLTSVIPFPSSVAKLLGDMIVFVLFSQKLCNFLVSSYLYNVMSKTSRVDQSDLFSILSEILFGCKVRCPYMQLLLAFCSCLCQKQYSIDLFCSLPSASPGPVRCQALALAGCVVNLQQVLGFEIWFSHSNLIKWNKEK